MSRLNDGRFLGFDIGAESVKIAELVVNNGVAVVGRTVRGEHGGEVGQTVQGLLSELGWSEVNGAAATGRMGSSLRLARIPTKTAIVQGVRLLFPEHKAISVVSIGAQGFSVVEIRDDDSSSVRENSRCSQGTGSFLRQLVGRFDLDLAKADEMVEEVANPAHLSGRCPVILKTDMTHLANKGEDAATILAGLYDAVCDNVKTLLRPRSDEAALVMAGGVVRSGRIRKRFKQFANGANLEFIDFDYSQTEFIEAVGAAVLAAKSGSIDLPPISELLVFTKPTSFQTLPPLTKSMDKVHRLTGKNQEWGDKRRQVIIGLDIGSTGSKAAAIDIDEGTALWDSWSRTLGNPVEAARGLIDEFLKAHGHHADVISIGVTGSGRQIVGSLAASAMNASQVFIMNEIAAHAAGAVYWDPEVDTIFELGGQDAKYIRLEDGRVVDAAMNEACSAGTGSFIEEQGQCFENINDVKEMGRLALQADHVVSLGQHCSVFMAEVIEQAMAAGRETKAILAGLYDSVISNYLNRVKGNRPVGKKVFCQGMPFSSDALAAAVARQTGQTVIVPPNPGTIGAVGIALLAREQLDVKAEPLQLESFLKAKVVKRDTFTCKSTKGCGEPGNKCQIDRLVTDVAGIRGNFTWGGSCSLYDKTAGRNKLPNKAPDPTKEREELAGDIYAKVQEPDGEEAKGIIALTDVFELKSLAPFFASFVRALGFEPMVFTEANQRILRKGIEISEVPWCAPMQMFYGVAEQMAQSDVDFILVPMIRELPRPADERTSVTCPVVQSAPALLRQSIWRRGDAPKLLDPVIEVGPEGIHSKDFKKSVRELARSLGVGKKWYQAWKKASTVQDDFDKKCLEIGQRALDWAKEKGLPVIVLFGRVYTLYNDVLNSNVPKILRELGALALPVDCLPLAPETPAFTDIYWRHGQANVRAAHQVRRTDGLYPVYCSNYSCGPDSFVMHFFSWQMANKPWAVIETDGHSGDAGTRTRLEAFLFCVEQDRSLDQKTRDSRLVNDFRTIDGVSQDIPTTKKNDDLLLIPPMGVAAYATSAAFRGEGIRCETLPLPDRKALELGRKNTSGKECVPMIITAGSILQRLEKDRHTNERFAYLMPTADGPCRFGSYNLLHKLIFERNGWADRVKIVSPSDENYFEGLPADFQVRVWTGMVAGDVLQAALHDVRPVETVPGAAQKIFDQAFSRLMDVLENPPGHTLGQAILDIPKTMGGVRPVLEDAAKEFAQIKDFDKVLPTVALTGEIYVRLDPFANDFMIDRLEQCGLKVRLTPFIEWIEYASWTYRKRILDGRPLRTEAPPSVFLTGAIQEDIMDRLWDTMAQHLGWGHRTTVLSSLDAGGEYVSKDQLGEAILTVGAPLAEYKAGEIDGVVSVIPLECMPGKIAESHYLSVEQDYGLPSMTLEIMGDSVDQRSIEDFAFTVKEHARKRQNGAHQNSMTKNIGWKLGRKVISTALTASAMVPLFERKNGVAAASGRQEIYLTPSRHPVTSRKGANHSGDV